MIGIVCDACRAVVDERENENVTLFEGAEPMTFKTNGEQRRDFCDWHCVRDWANVKRSLA